MTPEKLKRIHIALDQTRSIKGASSLLGYSKDTIRKAVKEHPELRSYLPDFQPPTETETIARPALIAPDEEELALAVKKSDEAVRRGFEAIGVTGDALTEALAFRDFGQFHFNDTRHYIGGGMAKLFADLMAEIRDCRREIADCGGIEEALEREKMLREDRSRLVKHAIDVHDRVREAALTAAVIEAKKVEAKDGKKRRQPAFAPLAMQVNGNVTIAEKDGAGTPEK
jgi:hypothetical protein